MFRYEDGSERMNFAEEYKRKLRTPEEAVKLVKDGDWVDYSVGIGFPVLLDAALAKRKMN